MPQLTIRPKFATLLRRECFRVVPILCITLVILVFLGAGVLAFCGFAPIVAIADELGPDAPGSIAGVVKDVNGNFLSDVEVLLYKKSPYSSDDWAPIRAMKTLTDGNYRFSILPVGSYRIGVPSPKEAYAPIFYPSAPTVQKAADLNITGNQLTSVDLILYPGGQITGVVTATVGFSLTTGTVMLYQELKRQGIVYWEVIQTDPVPIGGGVYTFTNLSADNYRICANGSGTASATYECYGNVYDINRASSVTVTASTTISNISIVLGDGADYGQISGRVTSSNHEPLANIEVYAIRDSDQPFARSAHSLTSLSPDGGGPPYPGYGYYPYTHSDSQGNYRLASLGEGNYRLMFRDLTGAYAFEYYNDSTAPEGATSLSLGIKQEIPDINVQLAPGGHIRGVITIGGEPASVASVIPQIKTSNGWQWATEMYKVSSDGQYDIGGLPAGAYRIWSFASIIDWNTSYFYQQYYFTPDTANFGEGYSFTEIPLTVGETKTANIVLSSGPQFTGSLSGRITVGGSPLSGAKVLLYPKEMPCCVSQWQPILYIFTDGTGRYMINGLTSGAFRLGVSDPAGLYATTYYTASVSPSAANVLYVEDGQALANVNVDLHLAGAISGRVTRPNGQPVPDLLVTISALTMPAPNQVLNQQLPSEIRTDADGRYTVKGLHPGDYNICFQDTQRGFTKCYGMLWWVYNLESGRISVRAGATTTDIDIRWGPDLKTYLPIIAR